MDISNESAEQIYYWVLNSPLPDLPIKELIYYYSNSSFLFSPPGKTLVAVKESKLRREARTKYDMTKIKVTTRPIKNSSENVEPSTISEFEEFMESVKQHELERQEFVGEPYYTEFKVEEERESTQRQMNQILNFIRLETFKSLIPSKISIEGIRQQLAMFRRTQESINLALKNSLRSIQQVANIQNRAIRDIQQVASIQSKVIRDIEVASVASIQSRAIRDIQQANIREDFWRRIRYQN